MKKAAFNWSKQGRCKTLTVTGYRGLTVEKKRGRNFIVAIHSHK